MILLSGERGDRQGQQVGGDVVAEQLRGPLAARQHGEQARRYGELKEQLSRDLASGDEYTRAKTALIQELVDAARDAVGLPRVPVWEE